MLDEVAQFNKARWEELAAAQLQYARPWLDLDVQTARQLVDPLAYLGDVTGKRVLCLGSGGGQQIVQKDVNWHSQAVCSSNLVLHYIVSDHE